MKRVIVWMACIAAACGSKPPPKTTDLVIDTDDNCASASIESTRSVTRFAHAGGSVGFELQSPGKKARIAILGLEVASPNGRKPEVEDVRVAQDLTHGLRMLPKAGRGPYVVAPGSEKELVDLKVLNACESEAKDCMTKIGAELGADVLVYGRIDRKSQAGNAGYQVSLHLLNIKNQAFQSWTDFVPLAEASGASLMAWTRKGYKKLTNDEDGGMLVVIVKDVDRGTILLDGEERGNISNSRGEVSGLAEGRYKLAVVASGFCRWTAPEPVIIRSGETVTEEVTMKRVR